MRVQAQPTMHVASCRIGVGVGYLGSGHRCMTSPRKPDTSITHENFRSGGVKL